VNTPPIVRSRPIGVEELAMAAVRAIAVDALGAIPIIGKSIKVGTQAVIDKLDKLQAADLDSDDVIAWIAKLNSADYQAFVERAIDLEPTIQTSALRKDVIEVLAASKPGWEGLLNELVTQDTKARLTYEAAARVRGQLRTERRGPTPEERRVFLHHFISLQDWRSALREIDALGPSCNDPEFRELDLRVARNYNWAIAGTFGGAILFASVLAITIAMGSPEVVTEHRIGVVVFFFLMFLVPDFVLSRSSWRVRRWLRRGTGVLIAVAVLLPGIRDLANTVW
jgi:hypothetical protein